MAIPFFNFYPGDWRSDPKVAALDLEERGAYMEVLCLMWTMGSETDASLPDDDALLAKMLHLNITRWRRLKAVLTTGAEAVLTVFEGRIYNKRLQKERGKAAEKSQQSREKVGKRWAKNRESEHETAYCGNTTRALPESDPNKRGSTSSGCGTPPPADDEGEELPELPALAQFKAFRLTARHRHIAESVYGYPGEECRRITLDWQSHVKKHPERAVSDYNADWLEWVSRQRRFDAQDRAAKRAPGAAATPPDGTVYVLRRTAPPRPEMFPETAVAVWLRDHVEWYLPENVPSMAREWDGANQ